jgi:protein tyrosine phosphatase (PTP) superfamily phosphohydrolase (DUF442 family)
MSRALWSLGLVGLLQASCTQPATTDSPPAAAHSLASRVEPPPIGGAKPVDYAGLPNVVTFADGLFSGSVPDGAEGFATLAAMGVKTVISVDGAAPDVEGARMHGIRYVHLPIGYNGMDRGRTLEIARAIHDLPGPIYLHCHHGKHRSASAAGAAAVALGLMTTDEATARMKVSGTAPSYTGLYQCVALSQVARAEELASAGDAFPETWKTSGLVKTMVEVDEVFEHLKAIEKAGWTTPPDHPDLVPVAEAGRLADLLRNLQDDDRVRAKPPEFTAWMLEGSRLSESLEEGLATPGIDAQELSARFEHIAASCKVCHVKYRDR